MMKSLSEAITRGVGRHSLTIQKNSPQLLFSGGVVGMIGSTVLACRATLSLEATLEKAQSDLRVARSMEDDDQIDHRDLQKTTAIVYFRSGADVAKLYAPSIVLGAASIAMLTKSHSMLTERNAALTAAYVALDKGFKEYRARVIEKYGEEADQNFRYSTEEVVVEQKGTKKQAKTTRVGPGEPSIYARFFDPLCPPWSKDPENNRLFLKCQQNMANEMLHSRGHLFLNEVYGMLGIPHSSAGAVVGWVQGSKGDNYVDFGIFVPDGSSRIRDFVNGREGSVFVDFNVDGVIYDLIDDLGEEITPWPLDQ